MCEPFWWILSDSAMQRVEQQNALIKIVHSSHRVHVSMYAQNTHIHVHVRNEMMP